MQILHIYIVYLFIFVYDVFGYDHFTGSGESRTLMKELAHAVASNQDMFANLKLMVLHRNTERMLADALGATDRITILYYHNSFSYKYSGKLRVQNILSSVDYVMSLPPDELPLKSLTTPEELGDFLDSTDKAVFLLEFCGWTPRLLTKGKNSTQNGFGIFSCFFLYAYFFAQNI